MRCGDKVWFAGRAATVIQVAPTKLKIQYTGWRDSTIRRWITASYATRRFDSELEQAMHELLGGEA